MKQESPIFIDKTSGSAEQFDTVWQRNSSTQFMHAGILYIWMQACAHTYTHGRTEARTNTYTHKKLPQRNPRTDKKSLGPTHKTNSRLPNGKRNCIQRAARTMQVSTACMRSSHPQEDVHVQIFQKKGALDIHLQTQQKTHFVAKRHGESHQHMISVTSVGHPGCPFYLVLTLPRCRLNLPAFHFYLVLAPLRGRIHLSVCKPGTTSARIRISKLKQLVFVKPLTRHSLDNAKFSNFPQANGPSGREWGAKREPLHRLRSSQSGVKCAFVGGTKIYDDDQR